DYKQMRNVHKGIKMEFYDAGHIPGSASILLELEGKRLLYTGDINNRDTRLLKGAVVPKADILVTETTYGNRIHPNRRDSEKALIASIEETVDSGGIALLPVFSVGRSQEILLVLQDLEIPIYLDGLAKLASKIIVSNGKYVKNAQELQKAVNHSIWIEHNNQRKDACKEPCIILTTAGMLNGGPVIQYMRMLAEDKKNSILLTGYQVEGTNGRLLLEKGHVIDPETQKKIIAKALIRQFDFSAHADQEGLLEIARKTSPEEVILVHGSPEATQALKQKMEDEYKVHTPKLNETIEI
ncbi:MAG: MBL fold metallo-hydrolase, partial [Candidatus Altiarchaeales archaeon]|nr:MBL fold metallo-hydrolase [Candidatus Altiarchaeales archaeon]